jgi:hypothetical protein
MFNPISIPEFLTASSAVEYAHVAIEALRHLLPNSMLPDKLNQWLTIIALILLTCLTVKMLWRIIPHVGRLLKWFGGTVCGAHASINDFLCSAWKWAKRHTSYAFMKMARFIRGKENPTKNL